MRQCGIHNVHRSINNGSAIRHVGCEIVNEIFRIFACALRCLVHSPYRFVCLVLFASAPQSPCGIIHRQSVASPTKMCFKENRTLFAQFQHQFHKQRRRCKCVFSVYATAHQHTTDASTIVPSAMINCY